MLDSLNINLEIKRQTNLEHQHSQSSLSPQGEAQAGTASSYSDSASVPSQNGHTLHFSSQADVPTVSLPEGGIDLRRQDYKQQIEALIFASDEALSVKAIRQAIGSEKLTDLDIEQMIDELNQEYEQTGRTFRIRHIAQGYRFLTEKQFHSVIQKLMQPKMQRRLSQAALETLAIIAYRQPISKAEIEAIRGTNADYVIRMLLERNLIEVSGRGEGVGKPLLYSTTKEFLDYFNLGSLSDLPKPREIEELMREAEAQAFVQQELNVRLKVEFDKDDKAQKLAESDED
ncbi:MAG: SMC-Scp complex subunit ScpB [Chloroherpetonaceae bacterium]|nr:SMC-Scp complex subunit ScpB [Chloroherpetonaceae bacterium]MCS7211572.1 SMC-Scp complex subunit ScpB [Chloroherpetonaceae bacterium]MDW8019771.1 SMC-Scp complex subunit ScpB [Chloroherpetonaceae bacterium]MDW8464801.1 SMC-Scp complex subunit ScpB [Chloroherpetonaceae bacterium]